MTDLNPSESFDQEDLEGILRRLALFESPANIARGYSVPVALVEKVQTEYASKIRAMRRGWRDWITAAEPLCNKTNQVLFLGLCARTAARFGEFRDALHALKDLRSVLESDDGATAQDQAILARIQVGDYPTEEAVSNALEVVELLDLPHRGSVGRGLYFDFPETKIKAIEAAANALPKPPAVRKRRKKGER